MMKTAEYINKLKELHLHIEEHTVLAVDPENFFDDPEDPSGYVDDCFADTELQLVDEDDHVLVAGDSDDICNYLKEQE